MRRSSLHRLPLLSLLFLPAIVQAGPYSTSLSNLTPNAPDPAIPGFTGPLGDGASSSPNTVNPAFLAWASAAVYQPAPGVSSAFSDPNASLGPVTGDNFDIVSLGDLSPSQIAAGVAPGQITLSFPISISNLAGPDFAVFENSFGTQTSAFIELAYVDVSSDGVHFARFASNYLGTSPLNAFANSDPTNIHNLAGKNVNASGDSWGTPFDLADLSNNPLIASSLLDLNNIQFVRITDIPGTGAYTDSTGNPIYDPTLTTGSGGFDLEAIGILHSIPEPASLCFFPLPAFTQRRRQTPRRTGVSPVPFAS